MKKFIKDNKKILLFSIPIILSLIITLCFIIFKHGYGWTNIFFKDKNDGFMDFFNSVTLSLTGKIYKLQGIYPPIIYYMYNILGHLVPLKLRDDAFLLRESYEGQIIFIIYSLICILFSFIAVSKLNKNNKYRDILIVLFLISFPTLYCLQRGNTIILACVFSMFYFAFYDSENKYLKEFSLVSLALSANIKLYPALFGLLLIKDKRYKDAIRCCIYGVLLFILPFFSFGGVKSMYYYARNIIATSSIGGNGKIYLISLDSTINIILNVLKIKVSEGLLSKLVYIAFPLGIIPFISTTKTWKNLLLLCLLFICIPHLSYTYTLMFLFIPALLILNEDNTDKEDCIYLIIISLLLSTIGFIPKIHSYYFFILFEKALLSILLMMVFLDGYIKFFKDKKKKVKEKK